MSPADRATLPDMPIENVEDGAAPPWRCQDCVKKDKYAVQRVVDVMRSESGQMFLLMEYLGYPYLEARPESWLEDKGELRLAYKAHATTRPDTSMLYCGGALLDAMRMGQPLKGLGLENKLLPREKSLYLISHTSAEKRGLSRGEANAYQMLQEPGHRLFFPFSLRNLQCTVDGRSILPIRHSTALALKRRHNSQPETGLQAIANHLEDLTANPASLPVALARALAGEGAWEGLGMLSGSSITDIVRTLTSFCQSYGPNEWPALLRQELPGLTDEDIEWLSDLTEEMEQYEPTTSESGVEALDTDEQDSAGTARSKKARRSTRIAKRDARARLRGAATMDATAPGTPPRVARKRKTQSPSQPNCRSTRHHNTRSSTSDAALVDTEDRIAHVYSAAESVNDLRETRLDQCAGSELARGHKPRGASHRPDPMSSSPYSTPTPASGAALVRDGDREAPHTHPVTTQRERGATMHHADEQSPPPSPLAASQRKFRPKLSRARLRLHGASHRFGPGLLQYLQIFINYLQCIGEQYSATGQNQVIYFRTDDMASTRDWKAIPPALDITQPTIFFTSETEGQRTNPVTDRSSGVGPIHGVEP